jgi:uncharacterized caspase-like protein
VAALPAAPEGETSRFALVIGSNNGSDGRKPLRNAEHDAARLATVLRELGSFRGPNAPLLVAPTAAAVRSALEDLRTRVQGARQGRPGKRTLALIYYSGHSDGRTLELGRERVEFEELQQALIDSGADTRLLIVDACQSGTLLALKGGTPSAAFDLKSVLPESTGEAILTSAAESEDALESAELEASYFSHHLLSGLRGAADADRDGRVTLSEAYQYASSRTIAETTATIYGAQHPRYRLRLSGQGDDLTLTELPKSKASVEVLGDLDRVLFIDALQGRVASEWSGGVARRLGLTAGPYLVKAWKDGRVLTGRLTLALGEARQVTPEMLDDPTAIPDRPLPPATPPPVSDSLLQRTVSGREACRYHCVLDPAGERSDCGAPLSVIIADRPRITVAIDMPSRRSLLRLRFEVCDPKGFWLHVADSPSCNGGGGDSAQFSNDAELELLNSGLWLFGNDYARAADKVVTILGSRPDFVAAGGCSVRTLVLADGSVRSAEPAVNARSPYSLRLDPGTDHEGAPDRRWYLGLNRSVGSGAPDRTGSGLSWLEVCIL